MEIKLKIFYLIISQYYIGNNSFMLLMDSNNFIYNCEVELRNKVNNKKFNSKIFISKNWNKAIYKENGEIFKCEYDSLGEHFNLLYENRFKDNFKVNFEFLQLNDSNFIVSTYINSEEIYKFNIFVKNNLSKIAIVNFKSNDSLIYSSEFSDYSIYEYYFTDKSESFFPASNYITGTSPKRFGNCILDKEQKIIWELNYKNYKYIGGKNKPLIRKMKYKIKK